MQANRTQVEGADFLGASFRRCRLVDLTFVRCRLVSIDWSGAAYHRDSPAAGRAVDCEIDDGAERFLTGQGVLLERCRRVDG